MSKVQIDNVGSAEKKRKKKRKKKKEKVPRKKY